jgi:predicted nucleic acid-binding protein
VNVAEVERGLHPPERRAVEHLLDHMEFLLTTREAAERAGRYQADWARRGRPLHLTDALMAGTARTHGAVLVTANLTGFPVRDIRVVEPDDEGKFG